MSNGKQYQYTDVKTEYVILNPEEFIIPEELPACKMLWDKGIETYICGNYEDGSRWIAIEWNKLSDENRNILDRLVQTDNRYTFGHYYVLTVPISDNSANELCDLVKPLQFQDTVRYTSGEEFLDSYKRQGGKMYFDDAGRIINSYNPELENDSLEIALEKTGKKELYDAELNRVYDAPIFMKWHENYINHLENIKTLTL